MDRTQKEAATMEIIPIQKNRPSCLAASANIEGTSVALSSACKAPSAISPSSNHNMISSQIQHRLTISIAHHSCQIKASQHFIIHYAYILFYPMYNQVYTLCDSRRFFLTSKHCQQTQQSVSVTKTITTEPNLSETDAAQQQTPDQMKLW